MQRPLQPDGSGLQVAATRAGAGIFYDSMMVRASAAALLAAIDPSDDAAVQVLIAALQDNRWDSWGRGSPTALIGADPEPRMIAAEALGRLGERARASIPTLRQILAERDRMEPNISCGKIAWALAQLDPADKECVSLINDYLDSPQYWYSAFYGEDVGRITEVLGERLQILVPELV